MTDCESTLMLLAFASIALPSLLFFSAGPQHLQKLPMS